MAPEHPNLADSSEPLTPFLLLSTALFQLPLFYHLSDYFLCLSLANLEEMHEMQADILVRRLNICPD